MNSKKAILYVGTIGFSYDAWANGLFYPSNLARSDWLAHYNQFFNAVEIAHSFSKVPEKEVFQHWYDHTKPEFRFSLRGNQYITHVKKLKGVGEPLKLFMEPALKLREKLACVVWEIPKLGKDQSKVLEAFVKHLQKYSPVQHFFNFSKETILEQKSLQLLREQNFEIISNIPQDSILEKQHYFRISSEAKSKEWEKDLLKKLPPLKDDKNVYIFFEDPQGGASIKQAKAFLEKKVSES